jgi:hypothetical protein
MHAQELEKKKSAIFFFKEGRDVPHSQFYEIVGRKTVKKICSVIRSELILKPVRLKEE